MPPTRLSSSPDYPQLGKIVVEASGNDAACKLSPGLYVVATPIGHRGDITLRALATLAGADVVACEDTRTSGSLLKAYGIERSLLSLHDHNEAARLPEVTRRIAAGEAVALISDAGLPAIADPGFRVVRACRDAGLAVTVIPGPNAAVTALAGAGLPTDRFLFCGFLPPKAAARRQEIASLKNGGATLVFYEAPQRLAACLADMADLLGPRPGAVGRELTKLYEETRRGSLVELAAHYACHEPRGEIVLIVGGADAAADQAVDVEALLKARLRDLTLRDAVAEVAAMTGRPKKEVYALALRLVG